MPSVAEILPKSSELEENGYVQGRIGLYNVDADDDTKIESDPERFFARTYPSGKLKSVLLDIDDNFRGHNPSGNYVIDGTFGSGKSHLMVTLYHLFSHPSKANEWLHTHDIDLEPPAQARIVSYSLQDTQPEIFWDPFFKTLEAEDLVEDVDAYPDKSTIENALPGDEPVLVLIDEIEDYYGSIYDETKKRGISGFIQALTEAAAEPDNELYTVASLLRLGEGSGIVSKFNRALIPTNRNLPYHEWSLYR